MTSFQFRSTPQYTMQLHIDLWKKRLLEMLPFLVLCILLHLTSAAETASQVVNYVNDEKGHSVTPRELFPSCVEVVDVWPRPGSVLRLNTDILKVSSKKYNRVIFRITFSRPVSISTKDTAAGLYRQHKKILRRDRYLAYNMKENWAFNTTKISPIFLSPSNSLSSHYDVYQTISNWRGSNKTYLTTISIMKKGFPQIE